MFEPRLAAAALLLAVGAPTGALAQDDTELEAIRRQIEDLRNNYENAIRALEQRLQDAEATAARAQASTALVQEQAQAAARPATPAADPAVQRGNAPAAQQSAFNPGISLILQGSYRHFGEDPGERGVTGYIPGGDYDLGERGFSLDESEITVSASIDHLFYGQATLALEDGGIEVEEAFVQTPALDHGLTVKFGRFFSGIGYENQQHPHTRDFLDPSLAQNVLLGGNFAMDALQVSWIAPLPIMVEIGGEIGMPVEFPFEDSDSSKNGITGGTVFARVGGDIGLSHSYRIGGWLMRAENRAGNAPILDFDERFDTGSSTLSDGHTRMWGLNLVYKWAPEGNAQYRNFKLVAEWYQRRLDGVLDTDLGGALDSGSFEATQSGWYLQGVFQFLPQWRVGLRFDQLDEGSYDLASNLNGLVEPAGFTPRRWSAMLDWNPSEYSRIRLQYTRDRTQERLTDDQIFLQYIFSLGAHGGHRF
ncbi:MAG: TonB-dependent receptor [Burkholderiales bacterium]|nr:TonB-dependent receptor [Burkholderiales bacterium]